MGFPHAAALALIGWYLMIPIDKSGAVLKSAPLADWRQQGPFNSADDCEAQRHELTMLFSNVAQGSTPSGAIPFYKALLSAQCVASYDPRLMEKR